MNPMTPVTSAYNPMGGMMAGAPGSQLMGGSQESGVVLGEMPSLLAGTATTSEGLSIVVVMLLQVRNMVELPQG